MKDPSYAGRKDSGSPELSAALAAMADETERITGVYRLPYDDLADIACALADIRALLDEIALCAAGTGGKDGPWAACRTFAERYRDLEGRVKEMRNDRCAIPG